jgi:hypothetical protein
MSTYRIRKRKGTKGTTAEKPEAVFGALLGTAVSIGTQLYSANEAKKARLEDINRENELQNDINNIQVASMQQQAALENERLVYDETNSRKSLYALGGKTKGLIPIGEEAYEVDAGSHESGNDLDIGLVKVEGDEVVTDEGVYSDRIEKNGITFAEKAKALEVIKNKVQSKSKGSKVQILSSAIDKELSNMLDEQEYVKKEAGVNKLENVAAWGIDNPPWKDKDERSYNPNTIEGYMQQQDLQKEKALENIYPGSTPWDSNAKIKYDYYADLDMRQNLDDDPIIKDDPIIETYPKNKKPKAASNITPIEPIESVVNNTNTNSVVDVDTKEISSFYDDLIANQLKDIETDTENEIDSELENIDTDVENYKASNKFKDFTDKYNPEISTGLNIASNLVGTAIQAKTLNELSKMKPRKRENLVYIPKNTTINANPQINAADEAAARTKNYANNNFTNAAARNSLVALSEIETGKTKANIYAQKTSQEKLLKNQELQSIEDITNRNINRASQDDDRIQSYERNIVSNRANLANEATQNITAMLRDVNVQNLDKQKIEIMLKRYSGSGVAPELLEELAKLHGGGTYQQILANSKK